MKAILLVVTLGLIATSLAGCGQRGSKSSAGAPSGIASAHGSGSEGGPAPPPGGTTGLASPFQAQRGGSPNEAAGLRWDVPAPWTVAGPRPMRVATYMIAPAARDSEGAECAVYYFGANQGGSVDANVQRWIAQFQPATGSRRSTRRVNGLEVSLLDVKGAYTAPSGPMMQSQGTKPGWRMRCAIVAGPGGPLFFKLTGPEKTMAAASPGFDKLVGSLRKE
ncbi:MAG TPA: hypothetical protein VMS88_01905 [Terriglobales bacterium]|nr:hypothetical protein [Terriglobales bacterium]